MAVRISVDIDDGSLARSVNAAIARTTALTPVLEDIRERMLLSIRMNFREGGRPIRWRPSRRAIAQHGQTLVDTARLQNSITGRIEGHSVVIGTNVQYAAQHQFGMRAKNLVARPFLLVQDADMRYIEEVVQEFLEEPLRNG